MDFDLGRGVLQVAPVVTTIGLELPLAYNPILIVDRMLNIEAKFHPPGAGGKPSVSK